ncbi:MAG: hypothetical protein ACYC9S_05215 [Leptospirales bacterium]
MGSSEEDRLAGVPMHSGWSELLSAHIPLLWPQAKRGSSGRSCFFLLRLYNPLY